MSKSKLIQYGSKRNFTKTNEPKGRVRKKSLKQPLFVVHKHSATRLHYDLRLEDEGLLKSWAIPKGPSEDPHDKRLAVQTEDHPYEYHSFEGVIPEGNYGAGPVIIWDKGTFQTMKDEPLSESIKNGRVEIMFDGEKLNGSYALIKTHLGPNSWLFFKMKPHPEHEHTHVIEAFADNVKKRKKSTSTHGQTLHVKKSDKYAEIAPSVVKAKPGRKSSAITADSSHSKNGKKSRTKKVPLIELDKSVASGKTIEDLEKEVGEQKGGGKS